MKHAIFLIPILALAACGPITVPPESPGETDAILPDIPTYLHFECHGYGYAKGPVRNYEQNLKGQAKLKDVVSFYLSAMPSQDWTKTGEEGTDPVKLTFVKKAEKCVVEVSSLYETVKVKVKISGKQ